MRIAAVAPGPVPAHYQGVKPAPRYVTATAAGTVVGANGQVFGAPCLPAAATATSAYPVRVGNVNAAATAAQPHMRVVAAPATQPVVSQTRLATAAPTTVASGARLVVKGQESTTRTLVSSGQGMLPPRGAGDYPVRTAVVRERAPAGSVAQATAVPAASSPATPPGVPDPGDADWIYLVLQNPRVLQQYAKAVFRNADSDGSGSISLEELESLIPTLHAQLGFEIRETSEDKQLARARMKKFDTNNDGSLSEAEFTELYRWTLWRKYEDMCPPLTRRADLLTASTRSGDTSPTRFYMIVEQMGEGQFGKITKVIERRTGEERALKTINREKAVKSGTPLNLLMQEIQLLAMLDHPHMLRLLAFYEDSSNVYLVTDVLYGGHLLEIVEKHAQERKPLPEAWVARVFRQSLEAIAYCHGKGVMHKDLKFENLMLQNKVTTESPIDEIHIVVIDMGLAELFGPQHGRSIRSNQIAGSMATIAPEVLCQDFSYKCDIWSLGCLLFAIFNVTPKYVPDGRGGQVLYTYPFDPEPTRDDPRGMHGMYRAQKAGPPMDRIASVSPEAQDVVQLMLTFDERNRPDARECVALPWFSIAGHDNALHLSEDQVSTLMQEHNSRLWWRSTMAKAATQLPASQIMQLSATFKSIDAANEGFIEKSELSKALQSMGVQQEDADSAADAVDIDSSGRIEWTEFVAALIPASHELLATSLQVAFQSFDLDGDGFIEPRELEQLLQSGQIDTMHMPPAKTAEMMIRELDPEGRGISFVQFHDYFLGSSTEEKAEGEAEQQPEQLPRS